MNRTKCLILALSAFVLVLAPANCLAIEDDAVLPPNTDNVEIHHVKMIDGVMHEDHPVIMYKEDFVNEDYDPNKNDTKTVPHKKRRHMHHHRLAVEEPKIPFDTLPDTPINVDDVAPSKEKSLQKHPKKYHSRQRRQVSKWLTSNYYSGPYHSVYYQPPIPLDVPPQTNYRYQTNYPYQRIPVSGKPPKKTGKLPYWQQKNPTTEAVPESLDNRLGVDESNPLFHNSNPADANFAVFDSKRPPSSTSAPVAQAEAEQAPISNTFPSSSRGNEDRRPIWGPSPPRRSNNVQVGDGLFGFQDLPEPPQPVFAPAAPAAAAAASAPLPLWRADALQFPKESTHQPGSSCQRAASFCCQLRSQLDTLYDCYAGLKCEQSISNIIADCS